MHLIPLRLFQGLLLALSGLFLLDGWFYADGNAKAIAASVLLGSTAISGAILAVGTRPPQAK